MFSIVWQHLAFLALLGRASIRSYQSLNPPLPSLPLGWCSVTTAWKVCCWYFYLTHPLSWLSQIPPCPNSLPQLPCGESSPSVRLCLYDPFVPNSALYFLCIHKLFLTFVLKAVWGQGFYCILFISVSISCLWIYLVQNGNVYPLQTSPWRAGIVNFCNV